VADFRSWPARPGIAPFRPPLTPAEPSWRDGARLRPAREGGVAAEIAFLGLYGMPPGPLLAATAAARRGLSADQVLLADGPVREDGFYRLLARHLGAPYFRADMKIAACDPAAAAAAGMAPLAPNSEGLRYVLAPRGRALALLLAARRSPPVFAIASPQWLGAALRLQGARQLAQQAAGAVEAVAPALSARGGLSNRQLAAASLALLGLPPLLAAWPDAVGAGLAAALFAAFAGSVALRLAALASAAPAPSPAPLGEGELPFYSIIVPLRREACVVGRLVDALDALDYPRARLDIKIVVERDDIETLTALAGMRLASRYDIIVAPPGAPATKPRALNLALAFARGEFIVIYDAEDAPAANQLRLAAARFRADPALDCLQARLVVDNIDDSWLTRGIMAQTPQESKRSAAHLKGHERAWQQIRAGSLTRTSRFNRRRDQRGDAQAALSPRRADSYRRDADAVRSGRRSQSDSRQAPLSQGQAVRRRQAQQARHGRAAQGRRSDDHGGDSRLNRCGAGLRPGSGQGHVAQGQGEPGVSVAGRAHREGRGAGHGAMGAERLKLGPASRYHEVILGPRTRTTRIVKPFVRSHNKIPLESFHVASAFYGPHLAKAAAFEALRRSFGRLRGA
jgi:hypothetical protein